MKFGYTIIYVPDVEQTLAFYERAFGTSRRFVHESGKYAELETGSTALAFASDALGELNLNGDYAKNQPQQTPPGFEIAFVSDDVSAAFNQAVAAGAAIVSEPKTKPWGQTVAYVRDVNGVIVEIGSPIG